MLVTAVLDNCHISLICLSTASSFLLLPLSPLKLLKCWLFLSSMPCKSGKPSIMKNVQWPTAIPSNIWPALYPAMSHGSWCLSPVHTHSNTLWTDHHAEFINPSINFLNLILYLTSVTGRDNKYYMYSWIYKNAWHIVFASWEYSNINFYDVMCTWLFLSW